MSGMVFQERGSSVSVRKVSHACRFCLCQLEVGRPEELFTKRLAFESDVGAGARLQTA